MNTKKKKTIKNYDELVKGSKERKDVLEILEAGWKEADPRFVINNKVQYSNYQGILEIAGQKFDLKKFANIYVVGFGKATHLMAQAMEETLKDNITGGAVISTSFAPTKTIKVYVGTHPVISKKNIEFTKKIISIARKASHRDLFICLISGGGSALFEDPAIPFEKFEELNKRALQTSIDIHELNTVRKHISNVKGGHLAREIFPATCISLIISDVPGDDLDVIASGPTIYDPTGKEESDEIIKRYGLPRVVTRKTPSLKSFFTKTHNFIILNNHDVLAAMRRKSEELGYNGIIQTTTLSGEAYKAGQELVGEMKERNTPVVSLYGGETTVDVRGTGQGGPNMELCLSGLKDLEENTILASIDTDGKDYTDAAGAIADSITRKEAQALGLNRESFLKNNDSYNFFEQTGDVVYTGYTGTNVASITLMLKR